LSVYRGKKEVIHMFGSEFSSFPWWIFPILMIALCFLMMRGRRGSMMCGFGSRGDDSQRISTSDSAADILDKRYALGEINEEEYEERKRILAIGN
jgi:uncharacterized membrane protein